MVVLEEGSMLTSGHNQYLQPDYHSPHPMTLDAKKSPLALLAQTCSLIGADSPPKPLISPLEKSSSKTSSTARSPLSVKPSRNSPSEPKPLAFKPYETTVLTKKASSEDSRPASKASVHSSSGQDNSNTSESEKKSESRTPPGRKSSSPSTSPANGERKTPTDREKSSASPRNSGASPIIRSGMEILSGHKDPYKSGLMPPNPLCCPPGLAENPAFRPPFAGAPPFSPHHAAAAAALLGYSPQAGGNPYLSYARVKTPSGGETVVPVCKDPYCSGCPYSMHNAQMMMGNGPCPSNCTQCDHQKYNIAMALSPLGHMPPPPSLSYSPGAINGSRSLLCSWVSGDTYCGKRYNSSEELLQHLRTHTSMSPAEHAAALLASQQHAPHPLLSPSAPLHRGAGAYPTPSISPLSARYHPYAKPAAGGPLPVSLASPYSAFNALGPYFSPYAIYGQRIGAAVHP